MIQEAKSHHFLHPEADFNAEVEQFVSIRRNFFMVPILTKKCPFKHKCDSSNLSGWSSIYCSRSFPVSQLTQNQHLDTFDLNKTEP